MQQLIKFLNSYPTSEFVKDSKEHPETLFTLNGDIFLKSHVTIEELKDIKGSLQEVYDNFEDGIYHLSDILSYFRSKKLESIGI